MNELDEKLLAAALRAKLVLKPSPPNETKPATAICASCLHHQPFNGPASLGLNSCAGGRCTKAAKTPFHQPGVTLELAPASLSTKCGGRKALRLLNMGLELLTEQTTILADSQGITNGQCDMACTDPVGRSRNIPSPCSCATRISSR